MDKSLRCAKCLLGALVLTIGLAGCSSLPDMPKMPKMPDMPSFGMSPVIIPVGMEASADAAQAFHPRQAISLHVTKYADARPAAPSRKLGDINATIMDAAGSELALSEDIPVAVTGAMSRQLAVTGFQVNESNASAEFEVSGVIKAFSLNIGERDAVEIVLETTLRDTRSGAVLWSGRVTEKADRFAGISGNTKKTISSYLNDALKIVTAKTRAEILASLAAAHPEWFASMAMMPKTTPGVMVLVSPKTTPVAASPVAAAATPAPVEVVAASGTLMVVTRPSRAKVYLADVYYGFSPIRLELPPGIHAVTVKLEGFRTTTEKVSVRRSAITEVEVKLEK